LHWRIYGDRKRLQDCALAANLPSLHTQPNLEIIEAETEGASFGWGRLTEAGAHAQVAYLRAALADLAKERVHALVTGPIHKEALKRCAVGHIGHTEWLAQAAGIQQPVMMLAGSRLRVVPATIHIPLAAVPDALSPALLREIIATTHHGMQRWLGFSNPRLGICGLNPHAGDGGLMGEEEQRWITPLLHSLRSEGWLLDGPLPADTAFFFAARGQYDAVIAMYHDQALAPLKLLHFEDAINLTLGLPYLRTSVDHGVAYDIAGKQTANINSMLHALFLAADALTDAHPSQMPTHKRLAFS
jgi:4-hydroxythreonine-4-phosphate dehydrogenase